MERRELGVFGFLFGAPRDARHPRRCHRAGKSEVDVLERHVFDVVTAGTPVTMIPALRGRVP